MQVASICIRKLGWKSSRAAYDGGFNSTKSDVFAVLYPPTGRADRRDWEKWIEKNELTVSEFDKDRAAKALQWAQSLEPGDSDYLHNISILANSESVHADKFGYVVSIIVAYEKDCEREVERKARADACRC